MTTAVATVALQEHRVYKRAGCFNLTAVIPVQTDRASKGGTISISQSWLPLSDKKFDLDGPAGYRCPNVIPVLSDRLYNRLAPSIDAYAAARDMVVQPVLFFYQPKAMAELLRKSSPDEDGQLVKFLPGLARQQTLEKRIFIDLSVQNENADTSAALLATCLRALEAAGLKKGDEEDTLNPRITLSTLLMDYPFLVHHIFNEYPALILLRHRARVNGRVDVINHIRYDPSGVYEIDLDKLYRKLSMEVTV